MNIKIGVIGTGAIGTDHIRRCSQVLVGAEVVAVTDINTAQAKAVVEDLNLKAQIYDNYKNMIDDPTIDAILVTSPGFAHEEPVLAAISAKKYVFCEKPLATTAQGCKKIVDAEMKTGKKLVQVGFMRPFDRGYIALKKAITSGTIGEPLIVHCAHRNPVIPIEYKSDMAIHDTFIHEIDVLRWLLDDDYLTVQVIYPKATQYTHSECKDPRIVIMETKKGIRIIGEIFVNAQYGYDIQCEVVGELGIIKLPEPMQIETKAKAKHYVDIMTLWKDRFIDAYDAELQGFIDFVQSGKSVGASAWDGYMAAIVADSCVKASNHDGLLVNIDYIAKPDFYK